MCRSMMRTAWIVLGLTLLPLAGCREQWETEGPFADEELESAFFAKLTEQLIPDVPEPQRLRPCCVFGNDVGVRVGDVPVPGYEVQNVLGSEDLGRHNYNNGMLSLQRPEEGRRLLTDEASGILYTCRGGFIDIAHVRDNADRTFYLAAQLARLPPEGGTIAFVDEGGTRRVVVRPFDTKLVHKYGVRRVVISLAEWISFQASLWHEIATWYRWSSTAFSEQPSAFSPEDLYSNLLGIKIAAEAMRRHAATSEQEYNDTVTAILKDALDKLGGLPADASRFAFEYVDGIWWDSEKRVPDNQLVRHRYFYSSPKLYPWKLIDALPSEMLLAGRKEYDEVCGGDWTPLGLTVAEGLGTVPYAEMATIEIRPDPVMLENGFAFPKAGAEIVTTADFPALIRKIEKESDRELGPGTGRPRARAGETSRWLH